MINIEIYKLVTCCKWSDVIGQTHPTSWQFVLLIWFKLSICSHWFWLHWLLKYRRPNFIRLFHSSTRCGSPDIMLGSSLGTPFIVFHRFLLSLNRSKKRDSKRNQPPPIRIQQSRLHLWKISRFWNCFNVVAMWDLQYVVAMLLQCCNYNILLQCCCNVRITICC